MIDDFSRPPSGKLGGQRKKPNNANGEDFFPDLSGENTKEPTFVTPEEVAAEDDKFDETIDLGNEEKTPVSASGPSDKRPQKPKKEGPWARFKKWFKGLSKKKKALFILAIILVFVGIEAAVYAVLSGRNPVEQVSTVQSKKKPAPTTVASNLTGLQVAPEINEKPVTGVMIENSIDARPQAGLSSAGIVFEAIAEGGITRFLALYQDTNPESIGPVRSARPYYIDWALGFDATYAHVGGSPEALQQIKNDDVKDMDQSYNSKYFERVRNRYAPHDVFTSIAQMNELEKSKGYGKSNFTSFPRKKEKAAAQPTAKAINLAISSAYYNVQYTYDAASNSYTRNLGGKPHVDETGNKQIAPKVVVAMVMNYSIASDGKHSIYNTVGNGQVLIFQDGVVTQGTWAKTAKNKQITFTDAAGKPIKLNPGQTWITAVNNAGSATYQP